MASSIATSFGYHANGVSAGDEQLPFVKNVSHIANTALKISLVALAVLSFAGGLSFPLAIGIGAFIVLIRAGVSLYSYTIVCRSAGIILGRDDLILPNVFSSKFKTQAFATEHSADTEYWRKKMLASAEHNIILSGNYCGGKSFDEHLDIIIKRLTEKPQLKVVIISSPVFLSDKQKSKIGSLQRAYPHNFSLVESPDIWHLNPGLKRSTNHTKCTVIDYGKYFILGGSGIKDNFAQTGLKSLSKQEFLRRRQAELSIESHDDSTQQSHILDRFIPGNFRDMDFVFQSDPDKNHGHRVFAQALLLAHRWEEYNKKMKAGYFDSLSPSPMSLSSAGFFTGQDTTISEQDSVTERLLKTKAPKSKEIATHFEEFNRFKLKAKNVVVKILSSGPENNHSEFSFEVKNSLKHAKKKIVINHMYFNPSQEMMDELVKAAKRGVKIVILSSGVYENCPRSHHIFGVRNKYNYAKLLDSLTEDEKKNVEIYEFQQPKIGNHKKVIIIDDYLISGSSNFGYKSLVSSSDHEMNFKARSQKLVDQTMKIVEIDLAHSKKLSQKIELSFVERVKAAFYQLNAPIIG
jgi:phosphatidylserine/phosphatidylglycerophosphate/cardiolipin synthase-like enzyme